MNTTNFLDDIEKSKIYENVIVQAYETSSITLSSVTDDKFYQQKDIDFILVDINNKAVFRNDELITFELKSDSIISKTGNLFIENKQIGDKVVLKGWIDKTEAKFLMYYDTANRVNYTIDMHKLKNYINKSNFRTAKALQTTVHNNVTWESHGYLVPLKILKKHLKVIEHKIGE